ncbi:hypothetical protein NL676_030139 [Syzygium grande]|nr:hypothetical protein NL676_030139 [Syzygium grande]
MPPVPMPRAAPHPCGCPQLDQPALSSSFARYCAVLLLSAHEQPSTRHPSWSSPPLRPPTTIAAIPPPRWFPSAREPYPSILLPDLVSPPFMRVSSTAPPSATACLVIHPAGAPVYLELPFVPLIIPSPTVPVSPFLFSFPWRAKSAPTLLVRNRLGQPSLPQPPTASPPLFRPTQRLPSPVSTNPAPPLPYYVV